MPFFLCSNRRLAIICEWAVPQFPIFWRTKKKVNYSLNFILSFDSHARDTRSKWSKLFSVNTCRQLPRKKTNNIADILNRLFVWNWNRKSFSETYGSTQLVCILQEQEVSINNLVSFHPFRFSNGQEMKMKKNKEKQNKWHHI